MRTTDRCPACGGELRADTRGGVAFRRCLSCGSALLDAAALDRLLPPTSPRGPRRADYDYPVHRPQDDLGHAAGRPKPTFAPPWGAAATGRTDDGRGLIFGR